jgi:hypothetical protein
MRTSHTLPDRLHVAGIAGGKTLDPGLHPTSRSQSVASRLQFVNSRTVG